MRIGPEANTCPCCGGPAPGSEYQWLTHDSILVGHGRAIFLTLREAQIFDVLWKARSEHYALSTEQIATRAFDNDASAPECELDAVSICIFKIRQKLKPTTLDIRRVGTSALSFGPGCQGTYRLLQIDQKPVEIKTRKIITRPESPSAVNSRRFNI